MIHWVNRNIVNVATTRAKYRLYVIEDEDAWMASDCIRMAKASSGLPSITSFATFEVTDESGNVDYSVDTSSLIRGLSEDFLKTELSPKQLAKFGFKDMKELDELLMLIKQNLLLGMKLYFLLEIVNWLVEIVCWFNIYLEKLYSNIYRKIGAVVDTLYNAVFRFLFDDILLFILKMIQEGEK